MPNKQNEQAATAMATAIIPYPQLRKIEDFAISLTVNIERAECILQDITEGYLGMTEEKQREEDYWQLKAGYGEASTKAEIVGDYLFELRKIAKDITGFFDTEWELSKKQAKS